MLGTRNIGSNLMLSECPRTPCIDMTPGDVLGRLTQKEYSGDHSGRSSGKDVPDSIIWFFFCFFFYSHIS